MGRFTSMQTLSDTNTKVVSGYAGGGGGEGGKKGVTKPPVEDQVRMLTGSTAGANSSEFHLFLGSRRRELDRIDSFEQAAKRDEEERIFAEKVEQNRKEDEERTRKNAEKRKRKKDKIKMKKQLSKASSVGSNGNGSDDEDHEINNADNDDDGASGDEGSAKRAKHQTEKVVKKLSDDDGEEEDGYQIPLRKK